MNTASQASGWTRDACTVGSPRLIARRIAMEYPNSKAEILGTVVYHNVALGEYGVARDIIEQVELLAQRQRPMVVPLEIMHSLSEVCENTGASYEFCEDGIAIRGADVALIGYMLRKLLPDHFDLEDRIYTESGDTILLYGLMVPPGEPG